MDVPHIVALLGAAVVAVPLFKRLGLGSVLGYLAAGLAIGKFGLGLFSDGQTILHVAELGVVIFHVKHRHKRGYRRVAAFMFATNSHSSVFSASMSSTVRLSPGESEQCRAIRAVTAEPEIAPAAPAATASAPSVRCRWR